MLTKQKFLKQFTKAVEDMTTRVEKSGTYFWELDIDDDENDWAFVLGWQDGFDEEPDDPFTDGTWRLCVKLAFQSNRSVMQCDYDIDWLMPYDEETGDVDDTEVSLYQDSNLEFEVDWLWKQYERIKKEKEN